MKQTRWILGVLCAVGVLLGWWIMGALVESPSERPALVARIQPLPALDQLPNLAEGTPKLIDSLVSPGGPVWLLLESKPEAPPLLCSFPRESNGGVGAPTCESANSALTGVASRARLAAAEGPSVLIPAAAPPHAAKALDAHTGQPLGLDTSATGLAVSATPGTRLVRRFQRTTMDGQPALLQVTPKEASYTGPVTGFAATHAPPAAPPSREYDAWICATPAGYIEARLPTEVTKTEQGPAKLEVAFLSRGERIAKTEGHLPRVRGFVAPVACTATAAIFTWFHQDGLTKLRCSPEGCQRSSVKVEDIPEAGIVALAQVGESTVVIWRDKHDRALVRLGPLESFGQSPTAPLWQPQTSKATSWRLLRALPTGQSLLLLVQDMDQPAGLKALQIRADGQLESLAPLPTASNQ